MGDVATVVAHLPKRGARLVQVPTTLLAAVDAALGGKGAVNVGGVKNALGVFHYAERGAGSAPSCSPRSARRSGARARSRRSKMVLCTRRAAVLERRLARRSSRSR